MAVGAGTKRKWDADIIPTFSDSDDIPDLDGEDEEIALDTPLTAPDSKPNKKRKKEKQNKAISKTAVKAENNQRKPQRPTEEEEDDEGLAWTAGGQDDGAFDPDFEFDDPGAEGLIEEGFDNWELPATSNGAERVRSRALGIEEIIERRRERARAQKKDSDSEDFGASDEEDEDADAPQELDEQDEELLADDAFGMGANADDEEDEEDGAAENSDEGSDEEDEDGDNHRKLTRDTNGNTAEDSDDDSVAAPVPHPDDFALGGDDASDEENQDPEEIAKRDAFFAPQEPDAQAVSKTEASFQGMSLSRPILRGLTAVGFTHPTPIQAKTVPVALMGKDVVGGAVTGSGKTAAFVLPILERLLYRPKKVPTTRVGILMPTRELAVQCYNVATKLAQFTDITFALIVGGLSLREQEQTLKKRPDIVIATPGRFIDHMRNTASFVVENLEILVLDEADRMLEEGFADELNEVLTTIPRSRQTMLFSATMTQDLDSLIRAGLNRPVRLMVDAKKQTVAGLTQEFIKMKGGTSSDEDDVEHRRLAYLLHLCSTVYASKTIIFLPTKSLAHRAKVLFALRGIRAAELHGSMSQEQRLAAITAFRDGVATHLLATDLASRGLDIPRVDTVINATVPTSATTYLHRVGRTARAGRSGVSCTIFSGERGSAKSKAASERTLLRPILRLARAQGAPIRTRTLPAAQVVDLAATVRGLQDEVDAVLAEEKEERLLAASERDVAKGENLVVHEAEIAARPRRTWFQGEREKKVAKEAGREERMGVAVGEAGAKKKGKLSHKEKKKLEARDERREGGGWKKGAKERQGGGSAARDARKARPGAKSRPKGGKGPEKQKSKGKRR